MDNKNTLLVVGAIVVAAAAVGIGILLGGGDRPSPAQVDPTADFAIEPVTNDDHIVGSTDAEVILVEYSDTECPFCKSFHEVVNGVVGEYEPTEFAWVYRHFPLTSIHSKAPLEAHATECAAELGGEEGFWTYTNRLYQITPSNNDLDLDELYNIAEYAGLDREAFEACQDSKQFNDLVSSEAEDAVQSGGSGTPYNVFALKNALSEEEQTTIQTLFASSRPGTVRISDNGKLVAISGGLPEETLTGIIDLFLAETPEGEEETPAE